MPFYKFLVHGRDVKAPNGTRGFWVVRSGFASTEDGAQAKVLASIERELMLGKSASSWRSAAPEMEVEKADRVGIWEVPRRHSGFIFYRNDGVT